ncbi:hypothetical protein UlMin_003629 [Ulmus minor]
MELNLATNAFKCRAFVITLTGVARHWFRTLRPGTISSFRQLLESFISQFVVHKIHRKLARHLYTITQRENETTESYLTPVDFVLVDCPSPYNAIIGRPTLNKIRAVTSTYHLLVKFPTVGGIGILRGDQTESREIYEAANRSVQVQGIKSSAKSRDETPKLIFQTKMDRSTTLKPPRQLEDLIIFLREHRDVFAWSHEDMPGIDPNVIVHRLNIDPNFKPIKQKRRTFNAERYMAINTEVDKLLKAEFIEEANYPDWIANVVLVKKANGNWRVCVDFTDLNRACPKDSFPLPRIDQLVDATTGHELLSFMDAYSGYNQI